MKARLLRIEDLMAQLQIILDHHGNLAVGSEHNEEMCFAGMRAIVTPVADLAIVDDLDSLAGETAVVEFDWLARS